MRGRDAVSQAFLGRRHRQFSVVHAVCQQRNRAKPNKPVTALPPSPALDVVDNYTARAV
jgi:hypothetical protein